MGLLVYPPNEKSPTGASFYALYPNSNKDQFGEGVPFSELVILKGEEKYFLFAQTDYKKPVFKIKGRNETPDQASDKNLPVMVALRHKAGKGYGDKDEAPTEVDEHVISIIEEKELATDSEFLYGENVKVWSCKFVYDSTKPEFIKTSGFDELIKVKKNALPDIPPVGNLAKAQGTGYNGKGYSAAKAQTEFERLSDISKFIKQELSSVKGFEDVSLAKIAVLANRVRLIPIDVKDELFQKDYLHFINEGEASGALIQSHVVESFIGLLKEFQPLR